MPRLALVALVAGSLTGCLEPPPNATLAVQRRTGAAPASGLETRAAILTEQSYLGRTIDVTFSIRVEE